MGTGPGGKNVPGGFGGNGDGGGGVHGVLRYLLGTR